MFPDSGLGIAEASVDSTYSIFIVLDTCIHNPYTYTYTTQTYIHYAGIHTNTIHTYKNTVNTH